MDYLNQYFVKVTNENTVWFCNRKKPLEPWLWRRKSVFLDCTEHMNFYVEAEGEPDERKGSKAKKYNIGEFWLKNPRLRNYKIIIFDPSHISDFNGNLNLFRGFKAKLLPSYDLQKIEPIINHICEVITGGNSGDCDYNLAWFAHIVHKPTSKPGRH